MKEKISIAMAAYNGEKYIKDQLDSFCKQTILPDELVVCDDCSTDLTPVILKEFKQKAPFKTIIIRNEKNLGSTKSFETALKNTSGDWICLSDQDDVWKENKIEEYIKAIKDSDENVGLIYCDYEIVDENLKPIIIDTKHLPAHKDSRLYDKNANLFLMKNRLLPGSAMILNKNAVSLTYPFSTKYHDAWLAWAISVKYNIKFLDKKLYLYRQHRNQQVGLGIFDDDKKHKTFFQKYIYDFEKYERRKKQRINSLKENFNFYKKAVEYLKKLKLEDTNCFNLANRGLYFYKMRLLVSNKNRLQRLKKLIPLYINGDYKDFSTSKKPFSEFRRDIEFPTLNIE